MMKSMTKVSKIQWLSVFLITGFLLAVYFFYIRGMFQGKEFPLNTFLPGPVTRFGDFYGCFDEWKRMQFNGIGYGLSYFPFTYCIVNIFAMIGSPQTAVFCLLTLFTTFFIYYSYQNLKTSNRVNIETFLAILACTFMSYPFLFTFHTANLEIFIFIFLALFLHFFIKEKYLLSVIPLSMAIAMKVFPAVFIVLFLAKKQYKYIFFSGLLVFFLSWLPLYLFKGGLDAGLDIYLSNLHTSQQMYADLMILSNAGNHFGHSLLNSLRMILGEDFPSMTNVLKPYLLFALTIFLFISFFIIFIERKLWKQVTLLVACMCLLPYTSTDYKLLSFFIPLYLFINDNSKKNPEPFNFFYIILFSLLLIPKSYGYFQKWPLYTINSVLNTLIMIVIILLIITTSFLHSRGMYIKSEKK
jgi:hypothetical protein